MIEYITIAQFSFDCLNNSVIVNNSTIISLFSFDVVYTLYEYSSRMKVAKKISLMGENSYE